MQTSSLVSGGNHPLELSRIAQDLQIRKVQVESVVQLLDEGNTVPFITRYRKERTGGLNEDVIRIIQSRVDQIRQLNERKQTVLKSIEGQGKLTDELRAAILAADTPKRLEDLYLPYKPKKRTLATTARERGLEPLALAIWNRDPAVANLTEVLPTVVNPEKELNTPDDVLLGVQHILAEQFSETADVRAAVRIVLWESGKLCTTKAEKVAEGQGVDFKDYFQFSESVKHIPPHRILAINRGEKENVLLVRLEWDSEAVPRVAQSKLPLADHPHKEFLEKVLADALTRLLSPSLEREIRRELTHLAEGHAVSVFARNLRSLLLAPPLRDRRVLAIDPGFRTGCKLAVLDETGNLLEDAVIFPHPPQNKGGEAKNKLAFLVRKHQVRVMAIGNGTACRETEELVSEVISQLDKRHREQTTTVISVEPSELMPPPSGPAQAEATQSPATSPQGQIVELHTIETATVTPEDGYGLTIVQADTLNLTTHVPSLVVDAGGQQGPYGLAANQSADSPTTRHEDTAVALVAAPMPTLEGLPEAPADLAYVIVNEAGASVYSASPVGREEFPNFDATLRGTISIGRRLQDPLSELVKIDPQNIGVGLYQHDVNPRHLKESLEAVIESCVNAVGVDLNTASVPLLRHVSGLNQLAARSLVEFRQQNGPFTRREQLKDVPNIGEARFTQAAGFLKIIGGDASLDSTWIHPESYPVACHLLAELGFTPEALSIETKSLELREKLKTVSPDELSSRLQVGVPTLRDMVDALLRPGRDPREDLPPPIFRKGILKLEDLQAGMELKGTVLNVVDFGAFVDIGLKDSGLVHISQMANRYIKNPYEVVAVGDVVSVWVLNVDKDRRRVSLTMIKPGTERKPQEKAPLPPRREERERDRRPPRGRQPNREAGPRGRQPGGPRPQQPTSVPQPAASAQAPAPGQQGEPTQAIPNTRRSLPPQQPTPPPRRPSRPKPKAKLSQAALEGEAPLRTFSELLAFYEAQKSPPPPAQQAEPVQAAASSEPPANP
jgi:protein Tex